MMEGEMIPIEMYAEEVKRRVKAEWERDLAAQHEKSAKFINEWMERNRNPDGSVTIIWMV